MKNLIVALVAFVLANNLCAAEDNKRISLRSEFALLEPAIDLYQQTLQTYIDALESMHRQSEERKEELGLEFHLAVAELTQFQRIYAPVLQRFKELQRARRIPTSLERAKNS